MEFINCSKCVRCNNVFPNDDMVCDAYGDSGVMMCVSCLQKVKEGVDPRFKAVSDSPEVIGFSFGYSSDKEGYHKFLKEEK